jgi:hypothetical protein
MATRRLSLVALVLCLAAGAADAATDRWRAGASALADAKAIAGVRGAIARACPCAVFDGQRRRVLHDEPAVLAVGQPRFERPLDRPRQPDPGGAGRLPGA